MDTHFKEELEILEKHANHPAENKDVDLILETAKRGVGLSIEEAAKLLTAGMHSSSSIIVSAKKLNERIKKKIITFYGVIYIHDWCTNKCSYCGDSCHIQRENRKLLTLKEFIKEITTLIKRHPLKELCFLMGEDTQKFPNSKLIDYLKAASDIYKETIILNVPPQTIQGFKAIRNVVKNDLQFRVFQETYDRSAYEIHHQKGRKRNFKQRVESQCRAIDSGFDSVGLGVLYGLSDNPFFETLAMLSHAQQIEKKHGKVVKSFSFPRLLSAPGVDGLETPGISDKNLERCIAVAKLTMPHVNTIVTCREKAEMRRLLRPLVNTEDFQARPGPGGNANPDETHLQMNLGDLRTGKEVLEEIKGSGFEIV